MTTIRSRMRGWLVGVASGALLAGTFVGLAPAAQADPVEPEVSAISGVMKWGFKESFRTYVGFQFGAIPPIGAAPLGERVELTEPATFDPPATGAPANAAAVAKPYRFPASTAAVTDEDNLTVTTTGAVTWNFPSHGFHVTLDNVAVEVVDGVATVRGDTHYVGEDLDGKPDDIPIGDIQEQDVPLGSTDQVDVTIDGDLLELSLTGLTLSTEGEAAFPFYNAGDELDDLTFTSKTEVVVSKTVADISAETTTVTVTGRYFNPEASLATRPPLGAGNPGGAYVIFGKFADDWKPSEGASSSARTVGVQKWAVLAGNMAGIGGESAGAVELREDGSFETDIVLDKEALDEKNPPAENTNYGIYTYAGGGGANANYETHTPITFVTSDVAVSLDKSSYASTTRTATKVKATITSANELDPIAGTVELVANPGAKESVLATTTLAAGGVANFTIPAGQKTGTTKLMARFSPDASLTSAQGTDSSQATLRVTKAKTAMKAKANKKARQKAAVRVNVQTGKGNPAATGRAVLRLKQGKKARVFRKKLNAKGNAKIVLKKKQVKRLFRQSNRPKWKGRVVYQGSAVYQKVHRPVVAKVKAKTKKNGKRIFVIKLNVRK